MSSDVDKYLEAVRHVAELGKVYREAEEASRAAYRNVSEAHAAWYNAVEALEKMVST